MNLMSNYEFHNLIKQDLGYSCDTCTVPHRIYWLSSDLGPRAAGLEGKGTTEPINYIQCAHE